MDPYAPTEVEAAEEWAMETLARAKLTPEEYRTCVMVGLAAVKHARRAAKRATNELLAVEEKFSAVD